MVDRKGDEEVEITIIPGEEHGADLRFRPAKNGAARRPRRRPGPALGRLVLPSADARGLPVGAAKTLQNRHVTRRDRLRRLVAWQRLRRPSSPALNAGTRRVAGSAAARDVGVRDARRGVEVHGAGLPSRPPSRSCGWSRSKPRKRSAFPTACPSSTASLGGGLVPASLVLVGGEPGVGKSTLLLMALRAIADSGGGRSSSRGRSPRLR